MNSWVRKRQEAWELQPEYCLQLERVGLCNIGGQKLCIWCAQKNKHTACGFQPVWDKASSTVWYIFKMPSLAVITVLFCVYNYTVESAISNQACCLDWFLFSITDCCQGNSFFFHPLIVSSLSLHLHENTWSPSLFHTFQIAEVLSVSLIISLGLPASGVEHKWKVLCLFVCLSIYYYGCPEQCNTFVSWQILLCC